MVVGDSQVVLELYGESPPAAVYTSVAMTRGLGPLVSTGLCHALPINQAQYSVTGVKSQNSLLPGEVVG